MTFFVLSFSVFPLYFLWGGVGLGWEGLGAESKCKLKLYDRESGLPKKRRIQGFSFIYANYTMVALLHEPLPTKFFINFLQIYETRASQNACAGIQVTWFEYRSAWLVRASETPNTRHRDYKKREFKGGKSKQRVYIYFLSIVFKTPL